MSRFLQLSPTKKNKKKSKFFSCSNTATDRETQLEINILENSKLSPLTPTTALDTSNASSSNNNNARSSNRHSTNPSEMVWKKGGYEELQTGSHKSSSNLKALSSRHDHTSCYINNCVYVFGGVVSGVYLNDLWCVDPDTLVWELVDGDTGNSAYSEAPPHAVGSNANSSVPYLSLDGLNSSPNSNGSSLSRSNSNIISKPVPRYGHTTCAFENRYMYVFGGKNNWYRPGASLLNDLWRFDTVTHEWTEIVTDNRPQSRYYQTACSADQQMLVFGGWNSDYLNEFCIFDTSTNEWQVDVKTTGFLPSPRSGHRCCVIRNEIMVVFGGYNGVTLNDLYFLDIQSLEWTKVECKGSDFPQPRSDHTFCSFGSKIVLFGGWNGKIHLNDTYVLDTDTLRWTQKKIKDRTETSHHSSCAMGNRMFVFGGWNGKSSLNELWILNTGLPVHDEHLFRDMNTLLRVAQHKKSKECFTPRNNSKIKPTASQYCGNDITPREYPDNNTVSSRSSTGSSSSKSNSGSVEENRLILLEGEYAASDCPTSSQEEQVTDNTQEAGPGSILIEANNSGDNLFCNRRLLVVGGSEKSVSKQQGNDARQTTNSSSNNGSSSSNNKNVDIVHVHKCLVWARLSRFPPGK